MPDPPLILPFLPPKRRSPSPFCGCHGPESPSVFSGVQGIILDSGAGRRLAIWGNPRLRLGRSTQFLAILGGLRRASIRQLRSSALPHFAAAAPTRGLCAPGTGAATPRPLSSGRRGEEALAPGLRSPAPSPRRGVRVRVCACARDGG